MLQIKLLTKPPEHPKTSISGSFFHCRVMALKVKMSLTPSRRPSSYKWWSCSVRPTIPGIGWGSCFGVAIVAWGSDSSHELLSSGLEELSGS